MIARFMKKAGLSFPTVIETSSKRTLMRRPVAQTMGFRKRAMTKMIQEQEAAEKEERVRFQTRYFRETKECPPLGLTDDYK